MPDLPGLTEHFFVADTAVEHPAARRSRNVAVGRSTVRAPIALADLLTIEELRPALDAAVAAYNETSHEGLGNLSPRHAYVSNLPSRDRLRAGIDLLSVAAHHAVTVNRGGVVVRRQRFRAEDDAHMPQVGTSCRVVVDPLLRAAWLTDQAHPHMLLRIEDAAKSPQLLESHINTREQAARASDAAALDRDAHLIEVTGDPEAPARAEAALQARLEALKADKAHQRKTTRAATKDRSTASTTTTRKTQPITGPASSPELTITPAHPRVPPPVPTTPTRPLTFPGFTVPRSA